MDLHRLRVVEFDTSVSKKEGEKKYMAEHEECKQEDWKTSTDGNKDETADDNQCLDDDVNTSPSGLSKKSLDDNISPPGTSKKYLDNTASPPGTSEKCPDDKICPPGTSEKYLDDTRSTSPPGTSKKDNFASSKLKSEIFKIPPKSKSRKRDLKINSSDLCLTKLFRDSTYLHQKKRTFNLRIRNSRLHHKVENVKEKKEKNEEVHFLFARDTPSFIKYCKKRAKNERTTTKKKRDSESPNDIYGFQKSTRSMDQHQYRMSCFNFIGTDKIPFKKLRRGLHRKPTPPQPVEPATKCACKHHAMRVLNSACEIVQCPSIYYNLGTHPRISQKKCDNDQKEGIGRDLSYCMVKDETVEVSPSSLEFVSISCRDAGTGPSKVELSAVCRRRRLPCARESPLLENVTITSERNQEPCPLPCTPKPGAAPAQNKGKKKRNEMKKTKFITNVPLGFVSRVARQFTGFQTKTRLTGESCIKYVFFGLLIVVWSPCLLAVFLAWVVMFPVKLTSILKMNRFRKKDPRCEYQRMCFENYLPKNKKSFLTSATSWYSRTVSTVANTLTSLLKLKKKSPTGATSSFLPSSHPNPRKRYTLFYADNRGWVMKPLRRRNTRPSASTRVLQSMRCEVRPKLRCHKNLPQKLKKAHPMQVDYSCPRYKSKAAGDACPLPCTRPKCNCCNKYSQGSSLFSRLESRYLRRQQVNIPPTICYPIFVTAFNSADRTINAKQFNSTDIADNIAHKDLAKYHLGQRKNGILPYGVVFNYPRGTKLPLIKQMETSTSHKFALAGKTLNMSTKCTPRIVITGLQRQLPKCWTKHEAGKAVIKSPGVQRIISFTDVTNSMPTKQVASYRHNTNREEVLNCPSGRNHKSVVKKKKLQTLQKNLNFRNKCVLADIPRSTDNKQANTSTHKINYVHKTQNTPTHILYHKVSKKSHKTEKAKPDVASKCAKHTPPKQAYKYKSDKTRVPTQKHSSPAKIISSKKPDTVLNYSFRKKQSKQEYKYNLDQIPVATQKRSNKADITTNTIRNKALKYPSGEKHKQTKQANTYKPHQISVATQKQPNKADITTSTNVNIPLNCPNGEKHEQSTKANKYIQHQLVTMTNRDIVLNCPCEDKHEKYEHCLKNESHQIPNGTQMQSRTNDNTTMTNRDILLNCPCEDKHEQYEHCLKNEPHQIHNATQMQSGTTDNTTMTNRDIVLNCPCEDKHEQYEHCLKNEPHQIPNATQMQLETVDNTTMTNRDIDLNCPCDKKHEQYEHCLKNELHQIPNATQIQSRIADNTTMTNNDYLGAVKPSTAKKNILCISRKVDRICTKDVCLSGSAYKYIPETRKHEQSKQCYKYKPEQITVATQKQSNKADITTSTNVDITLNCPSGEKHEQSTKVNKYIPHQVPVATQKQSNKTDITTSTNRNKALNYPWGEKQKQYSQANKYKPYEVLVATQMHSGTADNTTMTLSSSCGEKYEQSKSAYKYQPYIALNYLGAVKPSTANKEILCIPSTADKDTICTQKISSPEYVSKKQDISIQKEVSNIETSVYCARDYERSKTKEVFHPEQTMLPKQAFKYKPYKTNVSIQKQPSTADIMTSINRNKALNNLCGEKQEQSKQAYTYKPHQISVATQKQSSTTDTTTMTNRDIALSSSRGEKHEQSKRAYKCQPYIALNYLNAVKPSTSNKEILCIPITADKDTICTQNIWSPEYVPKKQDISIQKQASKVETSVYCASDYERSKIKEMVRPEKTVFPKKNVDCTSCCGSTSCEKTVTLKQASSFKKVTGWGWGLYKGTQTIAPVIPQENKCEVEAESPKRALTKEMVDCSFEAKLKQQILSIDCGLDNEQNLNKFLRDSFSTSQTILANRTENKLTKQPSRQKPFLVGRSLDFRHFSNTQKLSTRQFKPYANSSLSGISSECRSGLAPQITQVVSVPAADCRCGVTSQQNMPDKEMDQNITDSKNTNPHETSSPKKPTSQQPKFNKASNCRCGVTPQQNMPDKKVEQNATDSKNTYPHETSSVNKLPSQQPRLTQASSHTLKEQPKSFVMASDCPCETDQPIVAEKSLYNKETVSKSHTAKETLSKTQAIHSSTNGNDITPHSNQNRSVDKTLDKITMKETETSAIQSTKKFPKSPEPSPPHLLTSSTTHLDKGSRKTRLRTVAQAEFPQNLSIQQRKVSEQSRQYSFQTTDRQGPTSDQATAHPRKTHIVTETPPTTSTYIEELPCDCTCDCNSAQRLRSSESPQHLPSAQPYVSKIDSLHRTSQAKQSSHRTRKTALATDGQPEFSQHLPTVQPDIPKVDKTLSKFPKSPEHLASKISQATIRLFGIASDCPCGVNPPIDHVSNLLARKTTLGTDGQPEFSQRLLSEQPDISKIDSLHHSSQAKQSSHRTRKTTLGTDGQPQFSQHLPSVQPDISKVDKTLSKFPKSLEYLPPKVSQATSPVFGIAQQNERNQTEQIETDSKKTNTHITITAKAPSSQQTNLTQAPSHTLQEQPKLFGIASDCKCGTTQLTAAENSLYNKVTGSKSHTPTETQTKSPPALKQFSISPLPNALPHKCPCPLESLLGTKVSTTSSKRNVVNVDKTRSKFPKSPDHSPLPKSLPHKCPCPLESLLDSKGTQPYRTKVSSKRNALPHKCPCPLESLLGTKVSTTSSKRNVKVEKSRSKFPESRDYSLLSKTLPHKCRCPVDTLQDPVGEQPYGTKVSTISSKRNVVKVEKSRSKFPESRDHPPLSKTLPHKCRCPVDTLQDPVGEQPYGTKVSRISSKRNVVKVEKSRSKFPESRDHSLLSKILPHKCRCPVDTLQDPVGEQPYGTKVSTISSKRNVVKVDKTRSRFPKSPNHSTPPKSSPRKCRCPVESLPDPAGEQPYGTKVSTTSPKRNIVKVNKARSKFPNSPPEHSPPQKNSLHDCPCLESMQDSICKKTSQRSPKCFFSRKSVVSHIDLDKRNFESNISVRRNTTRQFSIRSCKRTEGPCSINEPSSRVQYRSKVSKLVMSLRCKLFSRKLSKQRKILENPTIKKPRSVILSSLQVNPKKVDKSHTRLLRHGQQSKTLQSSSFSPYLSNTSCPNDDTEKRSLHTRKTVLDGESNRSLFRRRHIMSKTSQNASLAIHSSHSMFQNSCSHVIHQSSSKQCIKKTRYIRKPLLVDKSYSCLRVSNTSQRPSSLSHSSKLDFRCQSDNNSSLRLSKISYYSYPKLSQHIRRQQSKTSDRPSIVMSQSQIECTSDETFSTPKDGMSHPILKTLYKRNSHSKSQHLLRQRNRSQFSAYCNRSQETMTQGLSLIHTIIPGMCRCAAKHLGKSRTSRQSNSRPQHFNRSQKPTSAQKQSSKKFDPQYSSSLNNYQPTPTAKTVPSQHPLSPEPLKSKRSSLFNRSQSKPLIDKIRSITGKVSPNSIKNKQDKTSSTVGAQTALTFQSKCAYWHEKLHQLSKKLSQLSQKSVENMSPSETPPHLLSAQSRPPDKNSHQARVGTKAQAENLQHLSIRQPNISKQLRQSEFFQHLSSVRAQANIPKIYSLHHSSQSKQVTKKVENQFEDAILQQPKAEQVIPILSGKCKCEGEQNMKTEYSSTNKLQPNPDLQKLPSNQPLRSPNNSHNLPTDTQRFPSPTASHSTRKTTLGTDGQPKFSQHLPGVQPNVSKIDSLPLSTHSKQPTEKVDRQFDAIPQQLEVEKGIPILSGKCRCAEGQTVKSERSSNNKLQRIQHSHSLNSHSLETDNQEFQSSTASHPTRKSTLRTDGQPEFSQHVPSVPPNTSKIDSLHRNSQSKQLTEKVEKQFDAIPQQLEAEKGIPILSGKCRCAEGQTVTSERSSNNKLQRIQHSPNSHSLRTDNRRLQSSTASHPTRKSTLRTDGQPEFSQHLSNQPLETPASKLSQPHPSQQADIPYSTPLHNSHPKHKKPCKCRISKHGNEHEIPNSLHTTAKTQSPVMSHYSPEKFQKSHLVSCVYPVNTAKKKRLRGHVIIQRSEISQSSENPKFPPNPQTRVYQQNLQHQKGLSQIQAYQQNIQHQKRLSQIQVYQENLQYQKRPPELLQQNSPGLGRTGTAEGGVQQPYPDFNRVSMRYPAQSPLRKQSEPIPGLNRQPSTAPPPKYGRDPCYTNPANKCAPKSPYSESALRRAYKRRPLRYTPPREQLPRVVMENKLKANKKKAAEAKKKKARKKSFFECLRDLVNQTDREAWPDKVTCHPMWLNALKNKPCLWIYKMWPRLYPPFLNFYKFLQYFRQIFVYLLTFCFWSPLLLCGYFCFDFICKGL